MPPPRSPARRARTPERGAAPLNHTLSCPGVSVAADPSVEVFREWDVMRSGCDVDLSHTVRPPRVARYNRTSYFYPTFSESSEHSHLLVSPVLVASAVIGVVIILSCITIIVGSIRRDRQARLQRHHHRHHRRHHHHHRRRRHRHREYEHSYVSDGHIYSRSSRRMHYACSPAEDWPPPLDVSSDGDVDATVLRELYPDSPPGYEECVGPGATQLYVPTDSPPPYSLTDSCPALDSALDEGSGHSSGRHQQAQRARGQSGLRTISMDTLPPYEAVCGTSPPSGLLPLPGPEPGPRSPQGSLAPTRSLASGPERVM
uniref:Brain expressed associated with NEDD4 1 n=1 Tax=Equus caballus TaxID=9796 RepID=F7DJG0_HORSE